jgi:hypothetical protein
MCFKQNWSLGDFGSGSGGHRRGGGGEGGVRQLRPQVQNKKHKEASRHCHTPRTNRNLGHNQGRSRIAQLAER